MITRDTLRGRVVVIAASIALLSCFAYGAAVVGEFVFDDVHSIVANDALRSLDNLWTFWSDPDAFSGGGARMYRPALLTSFALNMSVTEQPWLFKLTNVLLHAATAAMLFVWLWRLARRLWIAALAAALFAVHPLLSEAVNMVSARSELLCMFGLQAGLLAHLSFQRRHTPVRALIAMCCATVVACGSKETGVVLPALLVVQTFALRHRGAGWADWRRAAGAIAPVMALVVAYLVLRKLLLGDVAVQLLDREGGDPYQGHGRTLLTQLATMGTLLPRLVLQVVAPLGLSFDPEVRFYPGFADPAVLCGWMAIGSLTLAGLLPGPGARLRRIGVSFAWVTALPWIVVPLNMPFAEHRFYGVVLGTMVAAVPAMARVRPRRSSADALRLRLVFGVVLVWFTAGAALRSLQYQDERDLWRSEVARGPASFRTCVGLGLSSYRHGDLRSAERWLLQALRRRPDDVDVRQRLVEVLVSLDEADALPRIAVLQAAAVTRMKPSDPWLRTLVVQAELQLARALREQPERAREHFLVAEEVALSCLQIAEAKGYVYRLAAAARLGLGDGDGALRHLDTSIERGLAVLDARIERVRTLRELGRTREARAALLRLQRDHPMEPGVIGLTRYVSQPPR